LPVPVRAARQSQDAQGGRRVHLDEQAGARPAGRRPQESCQQPGAAHRDGRDPVRPDRKRDRPRHRLGDVQVGRALRQNPAPPETRRAHRRRRSARHVPDQEVDERIWPAERAVDRRPVCTV